MASSSSREAAFTRFYPRQRRRRRLAFASFLLTILLCACPSALSASCPNGFVQSPKGNCYSARSDPRTQSEAAAICSSLAPNSSLAIIANSVDDEFVFSLCTSVSSSSSACYVGLSRLLDGDGAIVKKCNVANKHICGGDSACRCSYSWLKGNVLVESDYVGWVTNAPRWTTTPCVRITAAGTRDTQSIPDVIFNVALSRERNGSLMY
jgi:hypothetical protein